VADGASAGEVAVALGCSEWRGVPGESQIRRGAVCLLLGVGDGRDSSAEERVCRVGRKKVGSWE
jgi:hypothetical protein